MNIKINNLSQLYPPSMYRIDISYSINDDCDRIMNEIHNWVCDNFISFDCLKYGRSYIFEDEENAVAFKIMWEH